MSRQAPYTTTRKWGISMNIGAWETYTAYLVKKEDVAIVDAYIKGSVEFTEAIKSSVGKRFKYRFLTQEEVATQVMSGWLKNVKTGVIFSSETNINPKPKDKVYFVDGILKGEYLQVNIVKPNVEVASYAFNKKLPNIIDLV